MNHTTVTSDKRSYHVINVSTFSEIDEALPITPLGFVLFLAVDAESLPDERIRTVAHSLLGKGCKYFSVWGTDCERVHDQFDHQLVDDELNGVRNVETEDSVVMTTWHSKDSIAEALWYSLNCGVPADDFASAYQNWIAVSVGSDKWEKSIHEAVKRELRKLR